MTRITAGLLFTILAAITPSEAFALITGGEGNGPITIPGWPAWTAMLFNHPGRVTWWEGPPLGGGQWHADTKALNAVLADFAKLDAKLRRVVVHDGAGLIFRLAPNREPEKLKAARVDWVFVMWQPARWERFRTLPANLNPIDPGDAVPPSQIDIFTGGIDWGDVIVPSGTSDAVMGPMSGSPRRLTA